MNQSNRYKAGEIDRLRKERDDVFKQMFKYRGAIRGTITGIYKMCSNKECECHSTNREKHGLGYYISSSHQGRTRMIYVPSLILKEAKKRTEDYKKVMELIERISEINSEIFKLEKEIKKGG